MSVTIKIISGADGSAFQTALAASIALGERPIGDPWSDGTTTYQQVEVHDSKEYFYNPDLLSRSWRASNSVSHSIGYPTSSRLSTYEYDSFYSGSN